VKQYWAPGYPGDQILQGGNKEFLYITHTVEYNYISPSSTIGIKLHVSVV